MAMLRVKPSVAQTRWDGTELVSWLHVGQLHHLPCLECANTAGVGNMRSPCLPKARDRDSKIAPYVMKTVSIKCRGDVFNLFHVRHEVRRLEILALLVWFGICDDRNVPHHLSADKEDGGRKVLRNVGNLQQLHGVTTQQNSAGTRTCLFVSYINHLHHFILSEAEEALPKYFAISGARFYNKMVFHIRNTSPITLCHCTMYLIVYTEF